jgi:hypothetical protein
LSGSGNLRYGLTATLAALFGLALAAPLSAIQWPAGLSWTVAGWSILAVVGVADGVWLNHRYGKPGTGFLTALVVGVLARLVLVGAGTALALRSGGDAPWAFLAGVAAGFVPIQVFEVFWFVRSAKASSNGVS